MNARAKVVVTRWVWPELLEPLRAKHDVHFCDSRDGLTPSELRVAVRDAAAVICQLTDRIDASVLGAAPKLRVVSTISVGFDHVDTEAAEKAGVVVTHTPGTLTETTADFAFGLLLAAARRIPEADRFVRAGRWQDWQLDLLCGQEIHGATLGIIGAGRIGRAVARRARGFDMRVLYTSRRRLDATLERELGVEFASFEHLLAESDFVSLHVPLTEATHHLIDAAALTQMKSTAILINTARGPVVDESALIDALENDCIAGAALDVFEDEPRIPSALIERERDVILAPHIASASHATRRRMASMAIDDALRVLAGHAPRHRVGTHSSRTQSSEPHSSNPESPGSTSSGGGEVAP